MTVKVFSGTCGLLICSRRCCMLRLHENNYLRVMNSRNLCVNQ